MFTVIYKKQSHKVMLLVVKADGPRLEIHRSGFPWQRCLPSTAVEEQIQTSIYRGTRHSEEVHSSQLQVKSDAKPVFHRPRSVPYAIKEPIEKELERLEWVGIIEKVEHSEWAAPIVHVPKGEGQIRVCWDYKVTVNANLDIDQHPLHKPEDLFKSLAGGQKFSKLDLKHAYQQMMLETVSKVRYNQYP